MLRIACVACLAACALTGCGAAPSPRSSAPPRLPRSLARTWERHAQTIAAAAAAGDGCRARRLADSLRDEVFASARRISPVLRVPLLAGVNALADRIACTPPADTVTVQPQQPAQPPPREKQGHGLGHGDGHGHGHGGDPGHGKPGHGKPGHGGDQGNQP